MLKLENLDSSYPSLAESKISDESLAMLKGGDSCSQGCKKQCKTQKKTQKVIADCVVLKFIKFNEVPINNDHVFVPDPSLIGTIPMD